MLENMELQWIKPSDRNCGTPMAVPKKCAISELNSARQPWPYWASETATRHTSVILISNRAPHSTSYTHLTLSALSLSFISLLSRRYFLRFRLDFTSSGFYAPIRMNGVLFNRYLNYYYICWIWLKIRNIHIVRCPMRELINKESHKKAPSTFPMYEWIFSLYECIGAYAIALYTVEGPQLLLRVVVHSLYVRSKGAQTPYFHASSGVWRSVSVAVWYCRTTDGLMCHCMLNEWMELEKHSTFPFIARINQFQHYYVNLLLHFFSFPSSFSFRRNRFIWNFPNRTLSIRLSHSCTQFGQINGKRRWTETHLLFQPWLTLIRPRVQAKPVPSFLGITKKCGLRRNHLWIFA